MLLPKTTRGFYVRLTQIALAAGILLGVSSTHAFAADDIAFYQGVVTAGYDLTGLFGVAGASLAGDSYTEYFYIDTSKGINTVTSTSDMTLGGSSTGLSAPISAAITINGHTEIISGATYGIARTGYNSSTGRDEIYDAATSSSYTQSGITTNSISSGIYSTASNIIPNHYDGYNITVDNKTVFDLASSFMFYTANYNGVASVNTYGALHALSAAPEPSTWLLMLAGVGGIGLAFRQAKKRHGFTFASALAS